MPASLVLIRDDSLEHVLVREESGGLSLLGKADASFLDVGVAPSSRSTSIFTNGSIGVVVGVLPEEDVMEAIEELLSGVAHRSCFARRFG